MWDWDDDGRAALGRFLADRGICGPQVSTRRVGDGHSNLTHVVDDGATRVVVRRPPAPPHPPGAFDVLREARLLRALEPTAVPVPSVLATAEAGVVVDVPLVVMACVDGPVVTTTTPPPLDDPATRREIGHDLVDVLAALHAVDHEVAGGKPAGSNARLLRRMGSLVPDPPSDDFARLATWLEANTPTESRAALLHNDFRIGNAILAPDPPGRVRAVLDWELAAAGDPLLDVGFLLACLPGEGPRTATQALSSALCEDGYPSPDDLVRRYAAASGTDLPELAWYVAASHWKLAALYEYQRRRATDSYYAGPTSVAGFTRAGCVAAGLTPKDRR